MNKSLIVSVNYIRILKGTLFIKLLKKETGPVRINNHSSIIYEVTMEK